MDNRRAGSNGTRVTLRTCLIAADETAVFAMCAMLESLPADTTGAVFLEVPDPDEIQTINAPPGPLVTWLPRRHQPDSALLGAAVRA